MRYAMRYAAVTVLVLYCVGSWPGAALAQASDTIMARLDALEKENAGLRDRVRRLESGRRLPSVAPSSVPRNETSPVRAVESPMAVAEEKPFNWSGPHLGAFGGINSWNPSFSLGSVGYLGNVEYPTTNALSQGPTAFGAIYGIGGGYDWQRGSFVFGIEGDIAGALGGNAEGLLTGTSNTMGVFAETKAIATARMRAGLALDRTFIYLTAGYAEIEMNLTGNLAGNGVQVPNSISWVPALALGGGVEYAVDNHWTVGGEALDLLAATNSNSVTQAVFVAGVPGTYTTSYGASPSQAVGKFRLNYKF